MVKKYCLLSIFGFFLFGICSPTLFAQDGYDLKQAMKDATQADEKEILPKFLPVSKNDAEIASTPSNIIQRATNYIAGIAAGVAILFIVFNAGNLVFAFGSSDDITNARKGLLWSIGGLILILFAFVIAKTIISLMFAGEP